MRITATALKRSFLVTGGSGLLQSTSIPAIQVPVQYREGMSSIRDSPRSDP